MKDKTLKTAMNIYCGATFFVCLIAMFIYGADAVDELSMMIGGLITAVVVIGGICGAFLIGYGAIKYLYVKGTKD